MTFPASVRLYQVLISIAGDIFTRHSCVSTVISSSDFHYRRYFHATFPCQYGYTKFLISITGDIFTPHSRVSTVIPSSDFHCRRYFHATFPCQYGYTKFWFPLQAIFSRDISVSVTVIPSSDFLYRRYFHATFPCQYGYTKVLISIAGDIFTRHSRVSRGVPNQNHDCGYYTKFSCTSHQMKKKLAQRCSWKMTSFILVIVCVALLACALVFAGICHMFIAYLFFLVYVAVLKKHFFCDDFIIPLFKEGGA